MNHSFQSAKWNSSICSICARPSEPHSNEYTCEACSNIGPVNVIGKMLLCASCEQKELNVPKQTNEQVEQLSLERIRQQVDRLVETNAISSMKGDCVKSIIDEAIQGNIKAYTDFFNASIPSIIELKSLIDSDDSIADKKYALAHALRARIMYLSKVLFQVRNGELEAAANIKAIQHYMHELIPELRTKLRNEFASTTPNYTPQVIKKTTIDKPKGPKGTVNKMAESYAKMMKIPYEKALSLLENKLRDQCTCSETPGICVVHK